MPSERRSSNETRPDAPAERLLILVDDREERDRLFALARRTPMFADWPIETGPLPARLQVWEGASVKTTLLAFGAATGQCPPLRLDPFARATNLIVVAPRAFLPLWRKGKIGRSFRCIASEDIDIRSLEIAARELTLARDKPRRQAAGIAPRPQALAQARADIWIDELKERIRSQSLVGGADRDRGLDSVADGALNALKLTDADLSRAGIAYDEALEASFAPDLNAAAESLVARWAPRTAWSLSVLVGDAPTRIDVSAEALDAFLGGFARIWRRRRTRADRLEWIVWDAGEDVRLVAIFAREGCAKTSGAALNDLVAGLLDELQSCAAACRAAMPDEMDCGRDAGRIAVIFRMPRAGYVDPLLLQAGQSALRQLAVLARS